MMANLPTSSDEDDRALNSLLDSFPFVSLDLIASAYTKADGDPNLAAELLSSYTSDYSLSSAQHCSPPRDPLLSSQHSFSGKKSLASDEPPLGSSQTGFSGRRSHPQFIDYLPSPREKNAWIAPLRERLQRNELLQKELSSNDADQADDNDKFNASDSAFPYLSASDVFSDTTHSSVQASKPSNARTSRKVSVVSGLITNARTRRNGRPPIEHTSHIEGVSGKADYPVDGRKTIHGRNSLASKTEPTEIDAAEKLLLSKFGDRLQIDIEAVRDVLGHYHGDLEKSLEALDQMATTTSSCFVDTVQNVSKTIDEHAQDTFQWVLERLCQEFPNVEISTVKEALHLTKFNYSDAEKILLEAEVKQDTLESRTKDDRIELSNLILKSLFKPREDEKEGQEKCTLPAQSKKSQPELENLLEPVWKVVSNSDSCSPKDEEPKVQVRSYGDWDDYERHHSSAKQHRQTMDCYLKAANQAYASGDVSKAELLSKKGDEFKQLAAEARERASKYLLEFKNPENENDFILDLKEQHVNEALQLLRLHLKTLAPIPSCNNFTVITGSLNGVTPGQMKVKQAVVRYLEKKEIEWVETSPFCLQVKLKKVQLEV